MVFFKNDEADELLSLPQGQFIAGIPRRIASYAAALLPEGEGLPKLYTRREMEKHRAVYLPPYALRWRADYPAAQICRSCSKIVVDYN